LLAVAREGGQCGNRPWGGAGAGGAAARLVRTASPAARSPAQSGTRTRYSASR